MNISLINVLAICFAFFNNVSTLLGSNTERLLACSLLQVETIEGFKLKLNTSKDKRLEEIILLWKGIEVRVPREELAGIDDVDLLTLKISTPDRLNSELKGNPIRDVVVTMSFGKEVHRDIGSFERAASVRSSVRFEFHDGVYKTRIVAIPEPTGLKWRFTYKSSGKEEWKDEEFEKLGLFDPWHKGTSSHEEIEAILDYYSSENKELHEPINSDGSEPHAPTNSEGRDNVPKK